MNEINKIFFYNSPVGKFFIKYDYKESKWALTIGDEIYGHYLSLMAAADDVYCQVTGCNEWDSIDLNYIIKNTPPRYLWVGYCLKKKI